MSPLVSFWDVAEVFCFFFQKSASGSNSQACLISGTKHKTGTISSCLVLPCSKTEYLAYIPNALFHPLFPLNLTCKTPRLDDYGSLLSRYIRCDRSQSTEEATGVFSEEEGNSRNVLKGDLSDTLLSWPQKLNPLLSQLTRYSRYIAHQVMGWSTVSCTAKRKLAGLCREWKISTALVKVWRGREPLKRGAYSRRLKGLVARDAFDVTVEHPLHWRFKKRTPKFSVVGTLPWTSENSLRSVPGKCVDLSWQGPGEKPWPRESLADLIEKRLSLTFSLQKSNPHLPDTLTQLMLQYNSMQRNNIIMGKLSSAPCGFSWPWIVGPREYFACSEDAIGTRKDPSSGCTLHLCCCILKTTARPQMLEVCHPCKALTCTTVHIPII